MSFYLTNSSQLSKFISFLVMCLLCSLHPSRVSNHFPLFVVLSPGSQIQQFLLSLSYLVSRPHRIKISQATYSNSQQNPSYSFVLLGAIRVCMLLRTWGPLLVFKYRMCSSYFGRLYIHTRDARQKIVLRSG